MKIAIGYLHQEVNAFSPVLTTLDNFSRKGIYYGNDIYQQFGNSEIAGFVRAARESNDVTLLPTMGAWAMPSGKLRHDDYLCLRKNFLTELKNAEPFDGILLGGRLPITTSLIRENPPETPPKIRANKEKFFSRWL